MSDNARDTQFQGFAKALLREMHEPISDYWREDCQEIMARRAYDLVLHTVENVDIVDLRLFRQEIAERIPDMTELPKEQE